MIGERYAKRPRVGEVVATKFGDVEVLDVRSSGLVLQVQTPVHGVEVIERHRDGNWVVKEPIAWAAWHQGRFPSVRQAMRAAGEWFAHPDRPANYNRLWIIRHEDRPGQWRLVNCGSRGPGYGAMNTGFYGPLTPDNIAAKREEHRA